MMIQSMHAANKPVAAVCHAPGELRDAKPLNGRPLVEGKHVTGFSNTEEESVQLTKIVHFVVEDVLKKAGGIYSKGRDWVPYVQIDGMLIAVQNPASSAEAAKAVLKLHAERH